MIIFLALLTVSLTLMLIVLQAVGLFVWSWWWVFSQVIALNVGLGVCLLVFLILCHFTRYFSPYKL